MNESIRNDEGMAVYEIGYLIAGVPEEQVPSEADIVRAAVTAAGASILTEEPPKREQLAYTIRKKTVAGSYDKYDEACFGWVKFELGSDKIEALKKVVEVIPSVLRILLITTVRENTYLGKHAPAVAAAFGKRPTLSAGGDMGPGAERKEATPAAPASVEEMDKSIDEMVKEA